MLVKKLVKNHQFRVVSWNMQTLFGKLYELVDAMIRGKINIMCVKDTKSVCNRSREIGRLASKIWYVSKNKHRNGVWVIVDKDV